jgi:hypothetical protein
VIAAAVKRLADQVDIDKITRSQRQSNAKGRQPDQRKPAKLFGPDHRGDDAGAAKQLQDHCDDHHHETQSGGNAQKGGQKADEPCHGTPAL